MLHTLHVSRRRIKYNIRNVSVANKSPINENSYGPTDQSALAWLIAILGHFRYRLIKMETKSCYYVVVQSINSLSNIDQSINEPIHQSIDQLCND